MPAYSSNLHVGSYGKITGMISLVAAAVFFFWRVYFIGDNVDLPSSWLCMLIGSSFRSFALLLLLFLLLLLLLLVLFFSSIRYWMGRRIYGWNGFTGCHGAVGLMEAWNS